MLPASSWVSSNHPRGDSQWRRVSAALRNQRAVLWDGAVLEGVA